MCHRVETQCAASTLSPQRHRTRVPPLSSVNPEKVTRQNRLLNQERKKKHILRTKLWFSHMTTLPSFMGQVTGRGDPRLSHCSFDGTSWISPPKLGGNLLHWNWKQPIRSDPLLLSATQRSNGRPDGRLCVSPERPMGRPGQSVGQILSNRLGI